MVVTMTTWFRHFSARVSTIVGSPYAFITAVLIVLVWASCGPLLGWSEDWQLVINTSTTIVTFLMVFLIQGAQNRESRAAHLKLDEIIRAISGARNDLVDLETRDDAELEKVQAEFAELARTAGPKSRACSHGAVA